MIDETLGGEALGDARLSEGLKRRHMTMIALGGVIGAGLFAARHASA